MHLHKVETYFSTEKRKHKNRWTILSFDRYEANHSHHDKYNSKNLGIVIAVQTRWYGEQFINKLCKHVEASTQEPERAVFVFVFFNSFFISKKFHKKDARCCDPSTQAA